MPHVLLVVLTSVGYRNFNGNCLHFVTDTFKILKLRHPRNGSKQHFMTLGEWVAVHRLNIKKEYSLHVHVL